MGKFKLSLKARNDIDNVWKYTFSKWSLTQADKYFAGLQNQFEIIANNPSYGQNYAFLRENYFGVKFKSHIIFYKIINSNQVEIIRILHEKLDLIIRLSE